MKLDHGLLLARRTAASVVDTGIEVSGGILGSYFGMLIAALIVTIKDGAAEQMQSSMWSGFGFGFMFWTFSLSFLNRVLVQGLSRASIGKKIFKLELISTGMALTWRTIIGRWVMGYGSFALCGAGYISAFFDKEGRTFHDHASHTDVVPHFVNSSMALEYREATPLRMPSRTANVIHYRPSEADVIDIASKRAAKIEIAVAAASDVASKTGTDDDSGSGSQAA